VNPQTTRPEVAIVIAFYKGQKDEPLFFLCVHPLDYGSALLLVIGLWVLFCYPHCDSRHGRLRSFHQSNLLSSSKHIGSPYAILHNLSFFSSFAFWVYFFIVLIFVLSSQSVCVKSINQVRFELISP